MCGAKLTLNPLRKRLAFCINFLLLLLQLVVLTMSNKYHHSRSRASSNTGAATRYDDSSAAPKSFDTYTDFALYISQRKCPKCNKTLILSSSQVESLFQSWLSNKGITNIQTRLYMNRH